jgi:hypothetical protein
MEHDASAHRAARWLRITVVVNIRPLKSAREEITGAINCFYDITQRKQAEEALQSHAQLQLHGVSNPFL